MERPYIIMIGDLLLLKEWIIQINKENLLPV